MWFDVFAVLWCALAAEIVSWFIPQTIAICQTSDPSAAAAACKQLKA